MKQKEVQTILNHYTRNCGRENVACFTNIVLKINVTSISVRYNVCRIHALQGLIKRVEYTREKIRYFIEKQSYYKKIRFRA
jgi:hypothetical protein